MPMHALLSHLRHRIVAIDSNQRHHQNKAPMIDRFLTTVDSANRGSPDLTASLLAFELGVKIFL